MSGFFAATDLVSASTVCTEAQSRTIESRVHTLINSERTSRGLAPLVRMQSIDHMALDWSSQMSASGNFSHRGDLVAPLPGAWRMVGENIVYWGGYSCNVVNDADRAVSLWMNSPGHRANILTPGFTHVGYGFVSGSSPNRTYGTQNFVRYEAGNIPPVNASASMNPTSGGAGTSVTVTGHGYPARFAVDILFGSGMARIGSTTTDANGSFTARVTVPNLPPGAHTLRVRTQNGAVIKDSTFAITDSSPATLSVNPRTVGPNGVARFTGANFTAGERVDIRWGDAYGPIIGYVTARNDGTISGAVTVRATLSGTYRIVARGTESHKAIGAPVVVEHDPPMVTTSPSSAEPGAVIQVTGQGFAPNERVNITWNTYDGPLIGWRTADANGTFTGVVTVPAWESHGTHYVYARGESSTITVRRAITLTPERSTTSFVANPQIRLAQTELELGQTTTLTGTGFAPGEQVVITTAGSIEIASLAANDLGQIQGQIKMPTKLPFADRDQMLTATGQNSGIIVEAPYTISNWDRAVVTLSPAEGPSGAMTTLTSSGFTPGETVTVTQMTSEGPVIATGVADEAGLVSIQITVPEGEIGEAIDLVVSGADGTWMGKAVLVIGEETAVTPEASPTPAETPLPEEEGTEEPATPAATEPPAEEPVGTPTLEPTEVPVETPTVEPTEEPATQEPTEMPVETPTLEPTEVPVETPTVGPTEIVEPTIDQPVDVPSDATPTGS